MRRRRCLARSSSLTDHPIPLATRQILANIAGLANNYKMYQSLLAGQSLELLAIVVNPC